MPSCRTHSPNAYEKVVDRLLASPRYGERMAARWLDAARYADTNGYQTDAERSMWRWRDWVIDAFNRNLPYDRFTVEQIAGDLLPGRDARSDHCHRLQPQPSRATAKAASFPKSTRWSTWWIAWRPRPPSGWA